jgi:hypothetical protein
MAIIPADEKVFMVDKRTNTTYGGSQALQDMQQWYTMADVVDSVGNSIDAGLGISVGVNDGIITIDATPTLFTYIALVTQLGTNAPTASIIANTFPETPTWDYIDEGVYSLEFADFELVAGLTIPPEPGSDDEVLFNRITKDDNSTDPYNGYVFYRANNSQMVLKSFSNLETPADGVLSNTLIELKVYK